MEFKRHISLSDREKRVLVDWGEDIFNSEALNLIWRPKQIQIILYDQGSPKSKCGLIKQALEIEGRSLLIAGIGGVVTPPQYRGRGYAQQTLRECLRVARLEWKADAAMLFCLSKLVPFYQAQQWQLLESSVSVYQPQGMVEFPAATMIYPFSSDLPINNSLSIDSLPW